MDSALRPREIQSRIRAGQSLEDVARLAGVPVERIEAYALPVLAEREHVAGLALASAIRRRGEAGVSRNLRPVVAERLTSHRIDPDSATWDAWRNEDRRWTVQARWADDETHTATFVFDLRSRFSVAADDEARWLISEGTPDAPAVVAPEESVPVRAVPTPPPAPAEPADEPTVKLPDVRLRAVPQPPAEPAAPRPDHSRRHRPAPRPVGRAAVHRRSDEDLPRSSATPLEIGEEVEAELDNYGVVPDGRSELDVLYDMLGGIAEDSINIYAGLADPVVQDSVGVPSWTPPAVSGPSAPERPDPEPSGPERPSAAEQPGTAAPKGSGRGRTGADQPPSTGDAEATVQLRPGASRRRRKGRAQVPSWEEIMFGGPKGDS